MYILIHKTIDIVWKIENIHPQKVCNKASKKIIVVWRLDRWFISGKIQKMSLEKMLPFVANLLPVSDQLLYKYYFVFWMFCFEICRPKYRYPYYDENGVGRLLYGYGDSKLYQYKSFSPLEGIHWSRRSLKLK